MNSDFIPARVLEADLENKPDPGVQETGSWAKSWLAAHLATKDRRWKAANRAYGELVSRLDKGEELYLGASIEIRLARGIARLEDEYFDGAVADPFMLQVYPVAPNQRQAIPAVTHVDGTARVHTVSESDNPLYHRLLRAFEARTGVPILVNTSFNENEPIVYEPAQAIDCFLRTDMDVLVLSNRVLEKRYAVESSEVVEALAGRA